MRPPLSRLVFSLIPLVSIAATNVAVSEEAYPPKGFEPLFNGKDLTGWYGMPHFDPRKLAEMPAADAVAKIEEWTKDAKAHWSVENGELVNDGHGAYLTTEREFGDMELLIDYKTVAKADSGIYLRGTPQIQIWDTTEEGGKWKLGADKGSGGLWNNSKGAAGKDPLVHADKPFGEWNRFRIRQVGDRTWVWLNGKLVVDGAVMENYWDRKSPLFPKGVIQLQTHGGEIRWRNIYVREIGPDEAKKILSETAAIDPSLDPRSRHYVSEGTDADDGFVSVFNGKDLSGWIGAVDNYEVVDGAIRCKAGKGGNLLTEKEYGDFVVKLEFLLPPGGNNGLAIRCPKGAHPAYEAMCELQVLDNDAPKYAKLDKRQYHGSAYGMVAAKRGHLKKPGEWNEQTVTVKGSTIKVELNGAVILDADLSKVTEFMANSPHPGKDLKSGHFGFAGHNDPVSFRKISIKELD